MAQPGQAGSQFPSEDALIRRIQDLEKTVQQLAAANPFAPMGMTPNPNGVTFGGNITANGNLNVGGTANFTGNTTIGGNATVTGNVTKSNSWGSGSLGDSASVGTAGAGGPALSFTRAGYTFGQTVGVGIKQGSTDSTQTALLVNGPHASDPAFLALLSNQTFNLSADNSYGSQISCTPGGNGSVTIMGGHTNGSVNIYPTGTGNCQVNGAFAVTGTKAFIMDHPANPDTMKLMHAATESPVNGVEYWGEATTGADGSVTVELPGYFEALTKREGRNTQLTATAACETTPWASPIENGTFTINAPAGSVIHWLVKAERQQIVDGYDVLSFPVEQDKLLIGPALPGA